MRHGVGFAKYRCCYKKIIGLCYWDDAKTKVDKCTERCFGEEGKILKVSMKCSPQKKKKVQHL